MDDSNNLLLFYFCTVTFIFFISCCSDSRLCRRGRQNYVAEDVDETDAFAYVEGKDGEYDVCTVEQDDIDDAKIEYNQNVDEEVNTVEFEGEFAADAEMMKAMGLPLSFIQSSQCTSRKVSLSYLCFSFYMAWIFVLFLFVSMF